MMDGLNSGGLSNINQSAATGAVASTQVGNIKTSSSADSVEKSAGSKGSNQTVLANSPELQEATYLFWFSNNQMLLQPYANNTDNNSISTANAIGLEINDKMMQIGTQVLEEWSKSIKEQGEADRREANSDKEKEKLERTLKAGYEAYLSTLTSLQRDNMNNYNTLTGVNMPKEGFVNGLDEILSNSKKLQPDSTIPFISGALLSAVPGSLAIDAMQTSPLVRGVHDVMSQIAPSYSVDLSTMASLYINGTMNLAALQTFKVASDNLAPKIDYEYARNYAKEILKSVSSSDFNSWAMAIVTHNIESGDQMDDKYVADLTGKLKISMLSTALSFLYYMESSVKGLGGGITGEEFRHLLSPTATFAKDDPKGALVAQIKDLLAAQNNSEGILSKISDWIDNSSKGLNLTKVSPLFSLLKLDAGGYELPVPA